MDSSSFYCSLLFLLILGFGGLVIVQKQKEALPPTTSWGPASVFLLSVFFSK